MASNELVLTNAQLVLRDEVVDGTVCVRDGRISAIDHGGSSLPQARDLQGDFLLPGIIDVHTDNLERHVEPRPGVRWPMLAALVSHDRQVSAAGVTTVLDALCVGDFDEGTLGRRDALIQARAVMRDALEADVLKADHRLHLRCEVASANVVESFLALAEDPLVQLVSVMDHTPGQRQWSDLDKWRQFNSRRNISREQLDATLERRWNYHRTVAPKCRRAIVGICRDHGLPLASHDDTTAEHVAEAVSEGIRISEFPTTLEAARLASEKGMSTVMGGPNVVMNGSHSGNVSALDLAQARVLDGLASDYVPMSLIQGAFHLIDKADLTVPQAVALVTAKPAGMVNLDDRGEIALGRRGDLIWVKHFSGMPVVQAVWRQGIHVC